MSRAAAAQLASPHSAAPLVVCDLGVPLVSEQGALLHAYGRPANLGELRAALERADKLAGTGPIDVPHLPERVRSAPLPNRAVRLPPEGLSLEEPAATGPAPQS